VCKAISLIKKNKTSGKDNLLNKYFIKAGDILAGHTELFNKMLNTCFFPVALMNSFNKTETAFFSRAGYASGGLSLSSV